MSDDRHGSGATGGVEADETDGFLGRWSRRKAQVRRGEIPPEPEEQPDPEGIAPAEQQDDAAPIAATEAQSVQGGDEPEAPRELPPLDSLDENSDYSMFMAADVDPDVRRDALRKLFRSPKFNVRDGLDDYDDDFSSPEPLGDIITAEMRRRMKRELERLLTPESDADSEVAVAATPAANETDNEAVEVAQVDVTDEAAEQDDDDDRTASS